jgi:hypothetical protein
MRDMRPDEPISNRGGGDGEQLETGMINLREERRRKWKLV